MTVIVETPPATEPVTQAEAKAHMHVDGTDDDALITRLIKAATGHIDGPDGWLGRSLVSQTLELVYDTFPCGPLKIPYPPLISVESVKYIDPTTGLSTTFGAVNYEVDTDSQPGWIALARGATWPTPLDTINAVRVRYTAGYTSVPEPIRHAILIMVADMYEHPETVVVGKSNAALKIPTTAELLLAPFRVW